MTVLKKLLRVPVALVRRPAVWLRDARDRRHHPRRKADAEARLAALAPRSVLVLCLGNVCRSPYAARVLAERAPATHVESAGFIGPGRAPPGVALEVARASGTDHADHRSKIVTAELLGEAGAVFVFDRFNVQRLRSAALDPGRVFWLGDFDPVWSGKRAVIDPWGKPREDFERTFARIDRCVTEIARILEQPTGSGAL